MQDYLYLYSRKSPTNTPSNLPLASWVGGRSKVWWLLSALFQMGWHHWPSCSRSSKTKNLEIQRKNYHHIHLNLRETKIPQCGDYVFVFILSIAVVVFHVLHLYQNTGVFDLVIPSSSQASPPCWICWPKSKSPVRVILQGGSIQKWFTSLTHTVDASEIEAFTSWYSKSPIIYIVLQVPAGAGVLNHQQ